MQSALDFFLYKKFSLKELDKLTGRKKDFWTWTSQIVPVLHDLGLKVRYFSNSDLEPFLNGERYFKEHFGQDADKILKFTDMPKVLKSIRTLIKYDLFEKKKITLEDIENYLNKGYLSLVLVDHNILMGKNDLYQGHMVVVTGFTNSYIYYHESGPERPTLNKRVKRQTFYRAMTANGTDNDVVVVFGKRDSG